MKNALYIDHPRVSKLPKYSAIAHVNAPPPFMRYSVRALCRGRYAKQTRIPESKSQEQAASIESER